MKIDLTKSGVIAVGQVGRESYLRFSIPFTSDVNQNELEVCSKAYLAYN